MIHPFYTDTFFMVFMVWYDFSVYSLDLLVLRLFFRILSILCSSWSNVSLNCRHVGVVFFKMYFQFVLLFLQFVCVPCRDLQCPRCYYLWVMFNFVVSPMNIWKSFFNSVAVFFWGFVGGSGPGCHRIAVYSISLLFLGHPFSFIISHVYLFSVFLVHLFSLFLLFLSCCRIHSCSYILTRSLFLVRLFPIHTQFMLFHYCSQFFFRFICYNKYSNGVKSSWPVYITIT